MNNAIYRMIKSSMICKSVFPFLHRSDIEEKKSRFSIMVRNVFLLLLFLHFDLESYVQVNAQFTCIYHFASENCIQIDLKFDFFLFTISRQIRSKWYWQPMKCIPMQFSITSTWFGHHIQKPEVRYSCVIRVNV